MRRFTFTLQPVLELRERRERERMQRLAAAQRLLQDAEARLQGLEAARDDDVRTVRGRHAELELEELHAYYAHLEHVAAEIALQRERVAACRGQVDASRAELVAASTEKKVVERLRERRWQTFQSEERLVEQRQVDDTNARIESRGRERGNP
ncbi:MAG TPA: flagellar export protein FliJ [Candidatus Dormibacteraeota bacterium]|nr:flagellar export protein FliJ [Candidatus Dormibacteraeota bacterium]